MAVKLPITIKLNFPIQDFGETVNELVIDRRLTLGDMEATEDLGVIASTRVLVQRLAGLTEAGAKSIEYTDVMEIEDALVPLMKRPPKPSKKRAGKTRP